MSTDKKVMYGLGSMALLFAALGLIFAVNWISLKTFDRIDLTENKQFTLSDSTKHILQSLENPIRIKAIYSSNIPSPKNREVQEIKDLLAEYKTYGQGKVELDFLDPIANPELKPDMKKLGVNDFEMHVIDVDQAGALRVYASIHVAYLDKQEVLNGVHEITNLEYDLSTTIAKLVSTKDTTIGLYDNTPQTSLDEEFSVLRQVLDQQFKVETVDTTNGHAIDDNLSVLIVIRPENVSERDLFEIDQYIMRGHPAILLLDGVNIVFQKNQYGIPVPLDYAIPLDRDDRVGELVKSWGVTRNYDLVQDKKMQIYPFAGPLGMPYPLFPMVNLDGDDKNAGLEDHPITRGLGFLVFTWASSLDLAEKPTEGIKIVKLAVSSPETYIQGAMMGRYTLNPMQEIDYRQGVGPAAKNLAVLIAGKLPSYFAGKPTPSTIEGDTSQPVIEPAQRLDQSPETSVLVVGTSSFISDKNPVLQMAPQGLGMVLSAIEWMTGGNKLSDIRNRTSAAKPLTQLGPEQVIIAGLLAPIAAPFGIVIFGVIRYLIRTGQQRKFLEGRSR